ncbi:MAG: hypothetical protein E6223_02785 [Clostridium botulinum]|nr:hypothetical protein [Clostridium botulinum]
MNEICFLRKDILRAQRDLKNCFDDIYENTSKVIYTQNIKRLIHLLETNKVLWKISKPFFEMKLDPIEKFGKITIPTDIDQQIGFVLQKLKEVEQDKLIIDIYAYELYMKKSMQDNINLWNKELVYPVFREMILRLDDLIEDEVKDKELINSDTFTIINYGDITTGNNSGVSIGKDIEQNISINQNDMKLFQELKNLSNDIKNLKDKNKILNSINEMQEHCGQKSFSEKYIDFMQNAANHMTVFGPLMPALAQLLRTIN